MPDRIPKTLAMRLLDDLAITYEVVAFPESIHDAVGVAEYAGLPPQQVFKTLVVLPPEPRARPLLILIPAGTTLDLRRAAEALGFKRLSMASQSEAERLTGLKVGGISALAVLARKFPVYLDRSAEPLETIVVSAGRRGLNLRLSTEGFRRVTGARWIDCARPDESGLRLE